MNKDIQQKCKDCPTMFTITVGEQEFLASKRDEKGQPLTMPKRCRPCRDKKKARYAEIESKKKFNDIMGNLSRGEKVTL